MSAFEDRLVKWSPRITLVLSATVVVLAGIAVYILIQYQPKTACQTDPAGRECQSLKVESDKYRTPRSACVITRLAGLGCPALEDRRRSLPDDQFPTGKGARNGSTTEVPPSGESSPSGPASPAVPTGPDPGDDPAGGSGSGGDGSPGVEQPPPSGPPAEGGPPDSPGVDPVNLCTQVNALGLEVQGAC